MSRIVYYVASSLDGYISGVNNDVSTFVGEGSGVTKYLADLQSYQTVIMGRRTYESGYDFGLKPGQPAYAHMQHHIFSSSLTFEDQADSIHIEDLSVERIKEIRDASPTEVYLCGGGQLAGWMFSEGLIDQLKIKLNPIVLGGGVPLFGKASVSGVFKLVESELYDGGLQIMTYDCSLRAGK